MSQAHVFCIQTTVASEYGNTSTVQNTLLVPCGNEVVERPMENLSWDECTDEQLWDFIHEISVELQHRTNDLGDETFD